MKNDNRHRIEQIELRQRQIGIERRFLLDELETAGRGASREINDDLERLGMESDDLVHEITRIKAEAK